MKGTCFQPLGTVQELRSVQALSEQKECTAATLKDFPASQGPHELTNSCFISRLWCVRTSELVHERWSRCALCIVPSNSFALLTADTAWLAYYPMT